MFDEKFLEEQKAKLLTEKERLQKNMMAIGKKDPHVADDYDAKFENMGDEEDDSALEVTEYETATSVETNLEDLLKKIDKALEAMEKGEYGKCANCGEYVPRERLQVAPEADVCIKCSEKKK